MSEDITPYGYRGLNRAINSQVPATRQQHRRSTTERFSAHWYCQPCLGSWGMNGEQMRRDSPVGMAVQDNVYCECCGVKTKCYHVHETDEAANLHRGARALPPAPIDGCEVHVIKLYDPNTPFFNLIQHYLMSNETTATPVSDVLVEQIARVCHETNKHYCRTIGDFTQHSWEEAFEWQRQSAINGVKYHLANPDASPENSHESWLREKEATGWKYGPVKDVDKKEHPSCVPYAALPLQEKLKDYLFRSVVHAFIDAGASLGK